MVSPRTYSFLQNAISNVWDDLSMKSRKLLKVNEDAILFIIVVYEEVWMKRTDQTNYNSFSRAAVIVEYRTREVIYLVKILLLLVKSFRNNVTNVLQLGSAPTLAGDMDGHSSCCKKIQISENFNIKAGMQKQSLRKLHK